MPGPLPMSIKATAADGLPPLSAPLQSHLTATGTLPAVPNGALSSLNGAATHTSGAHMDGAVYQRNGAARPVNGAMQRMNGMTVHINGGVAPVNGAAHRVNGSSPHLNGATQLMNGAACPPPQAAARDSLQCTGDSAGGARDPPAESEPMPPPTPSSESSSSSSSAHAQCSAPPSSLVLNPTALAPAEAELWDLAHQRKWDQKVFCSLAATYAETRQPEALVRLLRAATRSGRALDAQAVHTLCIAHGVDLSPYRKAARPDTDQAGVTAQALQAAAHATPSAEATHALFSVLKALCTVGMDLQAQPFVALLQAYGRLGLVDGVQLVLKEMRAQGLAPDIEAFSAVLSMCGRAQCSGSVQKVSKYMRARWAAMPKESLAACIHAHRCAGSERLGAGTADRL